MSGTIKELHWSHLSMYWRCPRQFFYRYIEGEKRPPGIALLVGSGTHESIDINLSHKKETGEPAEKERVKAAARDTVRQSFDSGEYQLTEEELEEGDAQHWQDQCVDQAVNLSEFHYDEVAPKIEPTSVERYWTVDLDGYPFYLAGTIDCEIGSDIWDWKTKSRSPGQSGADNSGQLTLYALARHAAGLPVDKQYLGCLMKYKRGPDFKMFETSRSLHDMKTFLRRIVSVYQNIEAGSFPPCDPGDWMCSPEYCGYYHECPYGDGRKTVHSLS